MASEHDQSADAGGAPSVLVVVPTLGERVETLRASLASVRAQRGVSIHLVVVVPETATDARGIARDLGATVVDDPRRGLSAAVNAGIAARSGESFYAWLGDDDLLADSGLTSPVLWSLTAPARTSRMRAAPSR